MVINSLFVDANKGMAMQCAELKRVGELDLLEYLLGVSFFFKGFDHACGQERYYLEVFT